MIQMIAFCMVPAMVYYSLGNPPGQLADIMTCQSLLTISVSAVPLPGAEGVTQGGFLQVFNRFYDSSLLTSAMLINRVVSFYIPLALSFLVYLFTHIRTAKHSDRGDSFYGKQD